MFDLWTTHRPVTNRWSFSWIPKRLPFGPQSFCVDEGRGCVQPSGWNRTKVHSEVVRTKPPENRGSTAILIAVWCNVPLSCHPTADPLKSLERRKTREVMRQEPHRTKVTGFIRLLPWLFLLLSYWVTRRQLTHIESVASRTQSDFFQQLFWTSGRPQ